MDVVGLEVVALPPPSTRSIFHDVFKSEEIVLLALSWTSTLLGEEEAICAEAMVISADASAVRGEISNAKSAKRKSEPRINTEKLLGNVCCMVRKIINY